MKRNYFYRIKILVKDRSLLFWTLLFPMLLSVFFNIALRDAYKDPKIEALKVAVINHDETVQVFLDSLEKEHNLIKQTTYTSKDEALIDLKSGEYTALVEVDNSIKLTFTQDTYSSDTTILNNIFQSYNTKIALITAQQKLDPSLITPEFIESITSEVKYVKTIADERSDEIVAIHFYTSIAMLCIYASQWGNKSAKYLQADMTSIGIRTNSAPTKKLKMLLLDISSVYTVFVAEFILHLLFLKYVVNAPFGSNFQLIALTGLLGGLLTTMFGYMICVNVKGSENKRMSIISMIGLFMSFMAGMMAVSVKYLVDRYLPILSKINPAALITDNFYWIFYETNYHIVYSNLVWMAGLTILFGVIAFRKLSVTTYDHI